MPDTLPPAPTSGLRIGHVHLKVSDLERALGFWRDVIGLAVMQRLGTRAAFLSADGDHHHIGLNTWESLGGPPPPDHRVSGRERCAQRTPTACSRFRP